MRSIWNYAGVWLAYDGNRERVANNRSSQCDKLNLRKQYVLRKQESQFGREQAARSTKVNERTDRYDTQKW